MHVRSTCRGWGCQKAPILEQKLRNTLLYKDIMKTKALIIVYLLTKLLFLAVFFVRLEGRRLVLARKRTWGKNV